MIESKLSVRLLSLMHRTRSRAVFSITRRKRDDPENCVHPSSLWLSQLFLFCSEERSVHWIGRHASQHQHLQRRHRLRQAHHAHAQPGQGDQQREYGFWFLVFFPTQFENFHLSSEEGALCSSLLMCSKRFAAPVDPP